MEMNENTEDKVNETLNTQPLPEVLCHKGNEKDSVENVGDTDEIKQTCENVTGENLKVTADDTNKTEENIIEHVKIDILEESTVLSNDKSLILSNSKVQVFVDRPLCADYRSDSDSDSDSESDSSSDSESDSDSDTKSNSNTDSSLDSDSDSTVGDSNGCCDQKADDKEKSKKKTCNVDLSPTDLPPIENLKISVPEDECQEIGTISSVIDTLVVIQAYKDTPALDLDTVLFLEKGQKCLGRIFDVLGPVSEPVYTVRFNKSEDISENNITKGLNVYCAPKTEYTSFVFVSELMKLRGSDASWTNNEEAPPECQDFSDDEEEWKFKKSGNNHATTEQVPSNSNDHESRKKVKVHHPRQQTPAIYRNPFFLNRSRNQRFGPPRALRNPSNPWFPHLQPPCFPNNPFCNPIQPPYTNMYQYPPQIYSVPNPQYQHPCSAPVSYQQGPAPYQSHNCFPNYPQPYPSPQYMFPARNRLLLPPPGPPPQIRSNPPITQPGVMPVTTPPTRIFGTNIENPAHKG